MDIKKRISICMIIKDEEENLDRCLNSLKPVLDLGIAELILVDTGSNDNSIKISKKYTKKVYEHKWNENFSEMRNISISYAQGEWLWIMDADEELENPKEMIKLFSGNLDKYNAISIRMKNYKKNDHQSEESPFNTSVLMRGFRNDKDFKYVGNIHEQPTFKYPYINSNVVLGHYGYIWEDKELAKKKYDRLTKSLTVELEKDPKNIYYQFQLASAYSIIDYGKGLIEMRKAYKLIQKLPKKERIRYLFVYGVYANIAYSNNMYTEVIKVCKEGLSYTKDYIDLWYYLGLSYVEISDNGNGLASLKDYLKCKERFETTLISKDASFTFYCIDDNSKELALYLVVIIYVEKNENNKALQYIKMMKPSDLKSKAVSNIGMKENMLQVIIDYLNEIQDDEETKKRFIDIIEKLEIDNEEKIKYINSVIEFYYMNHKKEDPYLWLNLIRKGLIEKTRVENKIIEKMTKVDFEELGDYYGDIITFIIKQNLNFSIFEDIGDSQIINRFMKYVVTKYDNIYEEIKYYLDRNENTDNINKLRIWIIGARYPLLAGKLEDNKYKELFTKYVDKGIKYIYYIYNNNILNEETINNIDDSEHKFFLYMSRAYKAKEKDKMTYIQFLRKALKSYPIKKGIEILLEEVKQESAINESRDNEKNEFEEYKTLVKKNISNLIKEMQLGEAKSIIDEYLTIVPDDLEMLMLKLEVQKLIM